MYNSNNPNDGESSRESNKRATRSNQRRLTMLIVLIFVVVISFFAGHYFNKKTPIPEPIGGSNVRNDSVGIPPDSLHH